MPFPFNLTGAWSADDGGVYYLRHLPDDTVTWAGLERSGFHLGVRFSNVFNGKLGKIAKQPDGTITAVIAGSWVDVPRGWTLNNGTLTLNVGLKLPTASTPLAVSIEQHPGGAFAANHWTFASADLQLGPLDTVTLMNSVARYDTTIGQNNPPGRDFSALWGTVGTVSPPTLPPANDYCTFRSVVDGHQSPVPFWNGDGDFDFDLNAIDWPLVENAFWTDGWVSYDVPQPFPLHTTEASQLLALYNQFGQHFHCEAAMYGRRNNAAQCADPPIRGVPGWFETGGDCVLINGRPISRIEVLSLPAPPGGKASQFLRFHLVGPGSLTVDLKPGRRARVSGVVAPDVGHHSITGSVIAGPPEIHPVYAIDIAQNFTARPPTANVNLSGLWHGSDGGSYYIRQLGNAVWFLGLSRDQGRRHASVFHGTLTNQTIQGQWVDIPVGAGQRNLTSGTLTMRGGPLSTELIQTTLTGFPAAWWIKVYDTTTGPPSSAPPVASPKTASTRRRRGA